MDDPEAELMDATPTPKAHTSPSDADLRTQLQAEIQQGLDELDRGETLSGPEVFAELALMIASHRKAR